jgi:hypothetical protein
MSTEKKGQVTVKITLGSGREVLIGLDPGFQELSPDQQQAYIEGIVPIIEAQLGAATPPPPKEEPRERWRAALQGLTFGAGDELEAVVRNPFSAVAAALGRESGQPYYDTLAEVRQKLADYRDARPWESLAYEVGGTAPLALITGGAATAARTGLGTAARLAGMGAGASAATGVLSREGDARFDAGDIAVDAAVGGVAAPALYGAMRAAGGAFRWVKETAARQLGRRAGDAAEVALRDIVEKLNITPDEAVARIAAGEALSDNQTLHGLIRRYINQLGAAATPARENIVRRVGQTRDAFFGEMDRTLNTTGSPNVARARQARSDAARSGVSNDYEAALRVGGFDVAAPPEVADRIADIFRLSPGVARQIEEVVAVTSRQRPYFRVTDDGQIEFLRPPTLREAELTRRALAAQATSTYATTGASKAAGPGWRDLEQELRGLLDQASPELAAARAAAAVNAAEDDAYKLGRQLLSLAPDKAEIMVDDLFAKVDPAARQRINEALRAGFMDAANERRAGARAGAFAKEVATSDRAASRNLARVVEPDEYERVVGAAGRARAAQEADERILKNSMTSAAGLARDTPPVMPVADSINAVAYGETRPLVRLAFRVIQRFSPSLRDDEKLQLLRYLTTDDAALVETALNSSDAAKRLVEALRARAASAGLLGALGARESLERGRDEGPR